jgi:uncharacterized protein
MRLGLLSDTHNNLANLRLAVDFFRREKIDTVFHLGDFTQVEISQQLVEFHVFCTFGNGDWDAYDILKNLHYYRADNFGGLIYRGEIGGVKIAATHGHLEGTVDELAQSGEFAYVFCGHSHRRRDERIRITRVINPGALGGLHVESRSCAVLDLETGALSHHFID